MRIVEKKRKKKHLNTSFWKMGNMTVLKTESF